MCQYSSKPLYLSRLYCVSIQVMLCTRADCIVLMLLLVSVPEQTVYVIILVRLCT